MLVKILVNLDPLDYLEILDRIFHISENFVYSFNQSNFELGLFKQPIVRCNSFNVEGKPLLSLRTDIDSTVCIELESENMLKIRFKFGNGKGLI